MKYINIKRGYTEEKINETVKIIENGGVVILPTDTVYGIVSDALNEEAVKRIYKLKGRDFSKPFNILVSDINMIKKVVKKVSNKEEKIINSFFPGALTIIFEKNNIISKTVTAGLDTIGIRMPDNNFVLEVIKKFRKTNCRN